MFEFAGGDAAFLDLATAFHKRCLEDPVLNHPFSHNGNPRHIENLAAYWAEVFGGPARYSEVLGGHSGMLVIHAGQGGGHDLGDRFAACFMQAADDARLPDDPELRAGLRTYIEWAVREVVSYALAEARVQPGLAIPRWSWNGLERVPDR